MRQNKLIEFRKSKEKTQEEMAHIWGISISHYKKIECGAKNPSLSKIRLFKIKFPDADIAEIFLN
jgi:DNA-binding XRE family transcriptional regulator